MKDDVEKIYNKLETLLNIAEITGQDYLQTDMHIKDVVVLMLVLKDYLEK